MRTQSSTIGSSTPPSSSSTSFATPGVTAATRSERAPVLLHDLEADQLERVVLVLVGRRQLVALDLERRAALDRAVELDHRPARTSARCADDLDRRAAREEARAGLPPALVVARLLDEERAVDPVRAADRPMLHPHVRRLSSVAIASSRSTATSRFSATNSGACGQALARVSRDGPLDVERRAAERRLAVVDERPERGDLALVRPSRPSRR